MNTRLKKCQKQEENEAHHSHRENGTVRVKKSAVIYVQPYLGVFQAQVNVESYITNLRMDFAPSAPEPKAFRVESTPNFRTCLKRPE